MTPVLIVIGSQAEALVDTRRLMVVNVLLVLLIVVFFTAIVVALVRRSMLQRVEAARLAAMGTATGRILHQVKNPLQTILLHAEMLDDERLVSDPATRREVCQAIVGEAGRMADLLGELSAYASGVGRRLSLGPCPLHVLVGDAARHAEREADRDGTRIEVGPLDEVVADGDPYFLRQAVDHVIRNALEALREHRGREIGRVGIALRGRGAEAVVEVRDNGPGIEADRIARIFEPFTTTKSKGMGLGLAICKEVVEGHGGRVELRSRPGAGTTVTVVLPIDPVAARARQSA